MTILFYIIVGVLALTVGAGALCIVTKAGERDGIANYNNTPGEGEKH